MLPKSKNEKAFIFIDPYEYKHIKANQIKRLLESGISEVLLWLPTQFMYRFSSSGTPLALKDFIEELTQYKDWNETDNIWRFIEQLKSDFQSFILIITDLGEAPIQAPQGRHVCSTGRPEAPFTSPAGAACL